MDYQHHFKKKYGQNFLNDDNILNEIIRKAEIPANALVIEIGPGAGALTSKLKDVAKNVIAYEIDDDLKDLLTNKFADSNVHFIWDDFLARDLEMDIKDYPCDTIYVIANIPYYITTPIIEKIINSKLDVSKIVIMVQKEVGERFCAKPGSKNYGSITVFLNYFYDVRELFVVSRNCFVPKPNVDSVVISLSKRRDQPFIKDEKLFFNLISDSFKYKRKMLRNNLKGYDLELVESILKKHGKDLSVRAEAIDLDTFVDLSNHLTK